MGYLENLPVNINVDKEIFMKTMLRKSVGVVLILLTVLSCYSGCIDNSVLHAHDYKMSSNETEHFMECSCGEIKDNAEHIFDWVVDFEPTYTAPGYKHKECSICGYKTEENTLIGILDAPTSDVPVLDVPIIDPTQPTSKSFVDYDDLKSFYVENREKINTPLLSIKATSDYEKGIYIVNESQGLFKYTFDYDEERDGLYIDPYIKTCFSVYSIELGTDTDIALDIPFHSFTLEFISKGCNQEIKDLRFVFVDCTDPDSKWERIVYVYDGNMLIGEAYLRFKLEISNDWFANYFKNCISILKKF